MSADVHCKRGAFNDSRDEAKEKSSPNCPKTAESALFDCRTKIPTTSSPRSFERNGHFFVQSIKNNDHDNDDPDERRRASSLTLIIENKMAAVWFYAFEKAWEEVDKNLYIQIQS